jgi:hypothetical protein
MLTIVIVFNILKAGFMLCVFAVQDAPLMVTGDAIATYLSRPDDSTKNQCLSTSKMVRSLLNSPELTASEAVRTHLSSPDPTSFEPQKHRFALFRAVGWSHFWPALIFITAYLATAIGLFGNAVEVALPLYGNIQAVWALGIGTASARLISTNFKVDPRDTRAFVQAVIVSNLPQLALSIAYMLYNNLLTIMLGYREWSAYADATAPKPLRVSRPVGQQRSTYFLQVPYRFGLPLLASSTILHWLVSQSLFFLRVDMYYRGVEQVDKKFTALGFSPVAILCALLVGIAVLLGAVGVGLMPARSIMPVVTPNSFAIAASCHSPEGDADAALQPVQWGETEASAQKEIGHISFTSLPVLKPTPGRLYL